MEIFKLFGSIFVDNDKANESISKTEKKGESLGSTLGNVTKKAGKFAFGLTAAAAAVGAGMVALSNKTAEYADHIDKTSMKMGVSRKSLQEWEYVAGQVGVSQEQMNKGLERLNQRMGRAANGNKKYTEALQTLGFSMDEVKSGQISTDEAMMRSIKTLNNMENSQKKSALASDLFGTKMARDLMPAIEAGTLSIEKLRKEANETGQVMSNDAIKASVKYADTVDKLKKSFGGLTKQIGGAVMPIIQSMLDWILKHMPQIQATFKTVFKAIGTIVGVFIKVIKGVIGWLQDMFSANEKTLIKMGNKFKIVMPAIKDFVVKAFAKIKGVMNTVWKFMKDNVIPIYKDLFEWIQSKMPIIKETVRGVFSKIKEVVTMVWGVFKNQLLPILATLYAKIKEHMPQIKKTVENVFGLIAKVVKAAWKIFDNLLIPVIKFLWNNIVKPLLPKIGKAIETAFNVAIDVINGAIDVIKDVIDWFSDAWDWLTKWNKTKAEDKEVNVHTNYTYDGAKQDGNAGNYPRYASGTNYHPGGMALVGERGPELVNLPRGSQVKTAQDTRQSLGNTFNFERMFEGANIVVRDDYDIEKIGNEIFDAAHTRMRSSGVK